MLIDKSTIITMVMIILIVIIDVLITKFISKRINPEEKIQQLNEQIDELNDLTDRMNDYLDSKIQKQTQKVIDANKEGDANEDDVDEGENKESDAGGSNVKESSPTQNVPDENLPDETLPNETLPTQNQNPNTNPTTDTSVIDNMMDEKQNLPTIEGTTNTNDTTTNTTDANATDSTLPSTTEPKAESQNQPNTEPNAEDVIIQQNNESTNTNNISDSQTNNVNCFVRTLTVENINMFNNGSLSNTTIQTVIEKFISTFNTNFEDLNMMPIGSVVYSIIPLHVSNDVFVYGRYYLRSLTNSNDPMDTVYNYQFQLPEHWRKASDFRFPNMKDRALQGKTRINFNLTDAEHKIESDNNIDVTKNVQDFTHTELKAVDFPTENNTEVAIQKGVIKSTAFWIKRETESKLEHGANKDLKNVVYTPKVLDQQSKLFFYVVLGYVLNV